MKHLRKTFLALLLLIAVQHSGEKAWDDLEIRVYPGADSQFTLYEDEGDGGVQRAAHRSESITPYRGK